MAYIMADLATGWVAGFDANDEPIFESKPALKHHTVTQNEWLFSIVVAAVKCGIDKIDFVRGGMIVKTKNLEQLFDELKMVT
jgi:hypothetical protein